MPFTGNKIVLIDFKRPLAQRKRKVVGPYYFHVGPPITSHRDAPEGFGFYTDRSGQMAEYGSWVRLRVEDANQHTYRRDLKEIKGYFRDETMRPIIARLPRRRGYLAGWTLGEGMASSMSREIHETAEEAARAAHEEARIAAEKEREYQASICQKCFEHEREEGSLYCAECGEDDEW